MEPSPLGVIADSEYGTANLPATTAEIERPERLSRLTVLG